MKSALCRDCNRGERKSYRIGWLLRAGIVLSDYRSHPPSSPVSQFARLRGAPVRVPCGSKPLARARGKGLGSLCAGGFSRRSGSSPFSRIGRHPTAADTRAATDPLRACVRGCATLDRGDSVWKNRSRTSRCRIARTRAQRPRVRRCSQSTRRDDRGRRGYR